MLNEIKQECREQIQRMWFLSEWDREDLYQQAELVIWQIKSELSRKPDLTMEEARLWVLRQVNNTSAQMRRHNSVCYTNTELNIDLMSNTGGLNEHVEVQQTVDWAKKFSKSSQSKFQVISLYMQGFTMREIEEEVSVSRSYANRIIDSFKSAALKKQGT